jgi:gas vesicle protein
MAINGDDVIENLERIDKKFDELENANKIRFERLREDIKKLGEGYQQGLKQISRQIKDLDKKWSDKWTPHDMALKDHGKRITALEQRQK